MWGIITINEGAHIVQKQRKSGRQPTTGKNPRKATSVYENIARVSVKNRIVRTIIAS
jgi:hypothetical protein